MLGLISDVDISREYLRMCTGYMQTLQFYPRNLSIHEFWYLWGVLK